jgi:hypothetical protein
MQCSYRGARGGEPFLFLPGDPYEWHLGIHEHLRDDGCEPVTVSRIGEKARAIVNPRQIGFQ